MGASVSVDVDLSAIDALADRARPAQLALTERVLEDSGAYVPVDTGTLQGSGQLTAEDELAWTAEYARAVYERDGVVSAGNPLGEPHWFEAAKSACLEDWVDAVASVLAGGGR